MNKCRKFIPSTGSLIDVSPKESVRVTPSVKAAKNVATTHTDSPKRKLSIYEAGLERNKTETGLTDKRGAILNKRA